MEQVIAESDKLYQEEEWEKNFELMSPHKDSEDPEIAWRYARAKYRVNQFKPNKDEILMECYNLLKKNEARAPRCANTHKWLAILLGEKENHASLKEKIEEGFVIRNHLDKSLEANPTDGYTLHVLGRWCFKVAAVSWTQRKVAATLFADPPKSSYEEALKYFKEAQKHKPDIFNSNSLLAAQCCLEIGDKKGAEEFLKECLAKGGKDQRSLDAIEEAKKLAKKHKFSI